VSGVLELPGPASPHQFGCPGLQRQTAGNIHADPAELPISGRIPSKKPLLRLQDLQAPDTPDRSGLPSGVRGPGADRFGWPFGRRGTPESDNSTTGLGVRVRQV
jgi:hypothetical protein